MEKLTNQVKQNLNLFTLQIKNKLFAQKYEQYSYTYRQTGLIFLILAFLFFSISRILSVIFLGGFFNSSFYVLSIISLAFIIFIILLFTKTLKKCSKSLTIITDITIALILASGMVIVEEFIHSTFEKEYTIRMLYVYNCSMIIVSSYLIEYSIIKFIIFMVLHIFFFIVHCYHFNKDTKDYSFLVDVVLFVSVSGAAFINCYFKTYYTKMNYLKKFYLEQNYLKVNNLINSISSPLITLDEDKENYIPNEGYLNLLSKIRNKSVYSMRSKTDNLDFDDVVDKNKNKNDKNDKNNRTKIYLPRNNKKSRTSKSKQSSSSTMFFVPTFEYEPVELKLVLEYLTIDSLDKDFLNITESNLNELFESIISEKYKIFNESFKKIGFYKISKTKLKNSPENDLLFEVNIRVYNINNKIFIDILLNEITDTRQKEMMRAENKMKAVFLSKIAHEFKTPIISSLHIINHNLVNDLKSLVKTCFGHQINLNKDEIENYFKNLKNLTNLSNYLLYLIADLNFYSTYTQEEDNKFSVNLEECDINETLSFIYSIGKTLMEMNGTKSKDVQLLMDIDQNLPKLIKTDEKRLIQILINLLMNSIKFTKSGFVKIEVKNEENEENFNLNGKIRITVEDTGIGISEERKRIIKNNCLKINSEEDNEMNRHGSGLGLRITNLLIDKLGEKFTIDSKEEIGTICSFVLIDFFKERIINQKTLTIDLFQKKEILLKSDNETLKVLKRSATSLKNIQSKLKNDDSNDNSNENKNNKNKTMTSFKINNQNSPHSFHFFNNNNNNINLENSPIMRNLVLNKNNQNNNNNNVKRQKTSTLSLFKKSDLNIENDIILIDKRQKSSIIDSLNDSSETLVNDDIPPYVYNFFENNFSNFSLESFKFEIISKTTNYNEITKYFKNKTIYNIKSIVKHLKNQNNNRENLKLIIVCDDTKLVRRSTKNIIQNYLNKINKKEYQIVTVRDGIELLYIMMLDQENGNFIKFVFLDEMMDYLNGSETFVIINNLIKNERFKKDFNVFSCTAYEDIFTLNTIKSRGIDEVLIKPLNIKKLALVFDKYKI